MTPCEHGTGCHRRAKWNVGVKIVLNGLIGLATYHVCGVHIDRFMSDWCKRDVPMSFEVRRMEGEQP